MFLLFLVGFCHKPVHNRYKLRGYFQLLSKSLWLMYRLHPANANFLENKHKNQITHHYLVLKLLSLFVDQHIKMLEQQKVCLRQDHFEVGKLDLQHSVILARCHIYQEYNLLFLFDTFDLQHIHLDHTLDFANSTKQNIHIVAHLQSHNMRRFWFDHPM